MTDTPLSIARPDAPTSPRALLLRHALEVGKPPMARRIFVNRTLRMEKIRCVGFDLDWTLAAYYRLPLEELTFGLALDRLVAAHDYPKAILKAEFRPHFPHRGLIVDRQAGTVLKMNRHRYVGRAYLGREMLSREERARLYRREPLDLGSERFYRADTLFELPEVNLFAELVELSRRRPELFHAESLSRLFADVRSAVDAVHADSTLKSRIAADLPRFLPRTPELALALERLRLGDRRLLLITNSEWGYTAKLCSYLFDGILPGFDSWRDLFSLVVVSAGKPDFFRKRRPFIELDEAGGDRGESAVPRWGGCYRGGSREGLMELLGMPGEQFLYIGDHIYGDIVSTKLTTTWRTALIVRELEDELTRLNEIGPQTRHLNAIKEELSDMGQRMDDLRDVLTLYEQLRAQNQAVVEPAVVDEARQRLAKLEAEHRALRHRAAELQEDTAMRLNPTWGSVFKQGGSQSLFGAQVEDFACLYTSRVSNFAYYGTNHYFRVLRDPMVHEQEG